jgi:hypothetical protein
MRNRLQRLQRRSSPKGAGIALIILTTAIYARTHPVGVVYVGRLGWSKLGMSRMKVWKELASGQTWRRSYVNISFSPHLH